MVAFNDDTPKPGTKFVVNSVNLQQVDDPAIVGGILLQVMTRFLQLRNPAQSEAECKALARTLVSLLNLDRESLMKLITLPTNKPTDESTS